jgi:hypothetical protein
MAGVGFRVNTSEIASGTSVKTLLQVLAASNHRILIHEISVSCKGQTSTDAPLKVEVLRQTTAGTMTSLTPVKECTADDETLQVTAQHTASAEPTASDILIVEEVHPQGGAFTWMAPFGKPIVVIGGARLGIRVTAGVSISVVARMRGEE